MIQGIDPRTVEVTLRLQLKGPAEFLGVKHHPERPPTGHLRLCGIDVELASLAEAAEFLAAATATHDMMRLAYTRSPIARQTPAEPTPDATAAATGVQS